MATSRGGQRGSGRVVGLDVARCLALLGMMATHVLPGVEAGRVTVAHQVASGRASALFAVLAGVSIALLSGRTSPPRGRARLAVSAGLAVRALLIAGVGLLIGAVPSGIAVILAYYGLLFLLALPFLGLRAPALAALGAGWLVVVPALSHALRPLLPPPSYDNPTLGALAEPGRLLAELAFTGYYPAVPWMAYLFAGMALGRLDLTRRGTPLRLVLLGGALATGSWLVARVLLAVPGARDALATTLSGPGDLGELALSLDNGLYGATPTGSWWWLAVDSPHTATPLDLAHTTGTALLVIGVSLAAGRLAPRLLGVLFGAGAMTLTMYSAHVVSRGQGLWDGTGAGTLLGQWAAVLLVGALVRAAGRRGPLEAAVARASGRARAAVG